MSSGNSNRKPIFVSPNPGADLFVARLYCIPHAGGGVATFHRWARAVDESVDIAIARPPGHESRISEQPHTDVTSLVGELVEAIVAKPLVTFGVFGQCSGAIVAFELVRELCRRGKPIPAFLAVSGLEGPHESRPARRISQLADTELTRVLVSRGTLTPRIAQNDELVAIVLPAIRADLSMVENYSYEADEPVPIPIFHFTGRAGRESPDIVSGWARCTTATCQLIPVSGYRLLDPEDDDVVLGRLSHALWSAV